MDELDQMFLKKWEKIRFDAARIVLDMRATSETKGRAKEILLYANLEVAKIKGTS